MGERDALPQLVRDIRDYLLGMDFSHSATAWLELDPNSGIAWPFTTAWKAGIERTPQKPGV